MRLAGAFLLAATGLLAACNPPPAKPPLLSRAEVRTVASDCGVSAATIVINEDKVRFDPPRGMPQAEQACVLKELRERLPNAGIEFGAGIKGQAEREGTKP